MSIWKIWVEIKIVSLINLGLKRDVVGEVYNHLNVGRKAVAYGKASTPHATTIPEVRWF